MLAKIRALSSYFQEEFKESIDGMVVSQISIESFVENCSNLSLFSLPFFSEAPFLIVVGRFQFKNLLFVQLDEKTEPLLQVAIAFLLREIGLSECVYLAKSSKIETNWQGCLWSLMEEVHNFDGFTSLMESPFYFPHEKFIDPDRLICQKGTNRLYTRLIAKGLDVEMCKGISVSDKKLFQSASIVHSNPIWLSSNSPFFSASSYFNISMVLLCSNHEAANEPQSRLIEEMKFVNIDILSFLISN